MRFAGCLLALAATCTLAPAFAEEPRQDEARPSQSPRAERDTATEAVVPECLEMLKLSKEQHQEIEGLVREYDADINEVWAKFGARYRATIALEASLLAAIEDNLTEAQRTHVREERRRVARHEKKIAGKTSKSNQATSKPVEAVDAVQEEVALAGVSLTEEQESAADAIQEKYLSQLRSMNRDIQGLHNQLVSLEADKLVEIEKVLTKDQLAQLREFRQAAPAQPKAAVSILESRKSE
jgi:hypothetical protein